MSKELEIFNFDGKPVTDSRMVAEWIGKRHKKMMAAKTQRNTPS